MTTDELAKCNRALEAILEMDNPARQSIAVAWWAGLYAKELLRAVTARMDTPQRDTSMAPILTVKRADLVCLVTAAEAALCFISRSSQRQQLETAIHAFKHLWPGLRDVTAITTAQGEQP